MDYLERYDSSSLDEKRTILSTLFSAYYNLHENNKATAEYEIKQALFLWGATQAPLFKELMKNLEHGNLGSVKHQLANVINELITRFSPADCKKD